MEGQSCQKYSNINGLPQKYIFLQFALVTPVLTVKIKNQSWFNYVFVNWKKQLGHSMVVIIFIILRYQQGVDMC